MRFDKWNQTVEKYGKSMSDILTDLYAKHGNHQLVAQELGVTPKGLRDWREKAGCDIETVVRVKCR